MDLIDKLVELQRADGLNDAQMAQRLEATGAIKLSRSMWNHIRRRKLTRGPSLDLANAACIAFPDQRDEIRQSAFPSCESA